MNTEIQNVAVLGAGIIGVNCAYELQKHGFNVTIIDKMGIGEGCSKGNAGHFATEQVFPLADPSLLCQLPRMLLDPSGPIALSFRHFPVALPWFAHFLNNMRASSRKANTKALKALNDKAIHCYKTLVDEIDATHLLTCLGSLLVFEDTPLAQVNKIAEQYRQQNIPLKVLERQQCLALEPNLSHRINYAIYFTDVAHTIEPYLLCKEIAMAATKLGAKYVQTEVRDIKQIENQVCLIGEHNKMEFDQLVIATGAWSKPLLNNLGYKLPIEAERGYHYQLGQSVHLNRPIASAERKFILTPMADGIRLAGTAEFSGLNSAPNFQRANLLLNHAKQLLNQTPNKLPGDQLTHQWHGERPSLPDSLPVIGKAPNHDNIYFALGHQHLGLTQGAITAKLIQQCITAHEAEIDIRPFCISRFN